MDNVWTDKNVCAMIDDYFGIEAASDLRRRDKQQFGDRENGETATIPNVAIKNDSVVNIVISGKNAYPRILT